MSLLDQLRPSSPPVSEVPRDVKDRMARGRKEMLKDASKRRLCQQFEKGNTYAWLNENGTILFQNTVTAANGSGKPRHRIRNTYNLIRPIIEDKVSSATQRVPGYEINASSTDPEDRAAAHIATQVAIYGYDQWRVRDTTTDMCTYAIGHGGDAFSFSYFDPNVGPFIPVRGEDGGVEYQGQGEVKDLVLGGNEVYWEAGMKFQESPWHAFERAEAVDVVKAYPGYLGGDLKPDASTSDIPTDATGRDHMVMVTNYLERPTARNPKGRWLKVAGGRLICPPEDFPLQDTDGSILDEPALDRLRYKHDPETDRDLGLTWQLIDAQRTVQDCANKLLEWKNRCLNPRMTAVVGSLIRPPDDEPGGVDYYKPIGGEKPQWQPTPPVPEALFRMMDEFKQLMRDMSSYEDVHADPNVAAKTISQVIEQSDARWQSFLGDLAEWHSRSMRHRLLLVARFYTEPRLIEVNGRYSAYLIKDFRGAKLNGQVNVTVRPGSLQYRTRQEIQNRISWIAANFPGYLNPEKTIAALDDGSAERLIESYELDEGKINRIIQGIRDGSIMDMPTRDHVDPVTGQPIVDPATGMPEQVPMFMPDQQDNELVWKLTLSDFMKTQEYERLPAEMQSIARDIYLGIQRQEADKQAQAAMQRDQTAQALGAQNAAKPQEPAQMPSLPALNPA